MKFSQPIAIVGMGGVFPGGLDFQSFWDIIVTAKDMAKEPPHNRWLFSPQEIFDPKKGATDKVYSKKGCFIENFVPNLQGLQLEECDDLDTLFKLVLHCGKQAFDDAYMEKIDRNRVKVILGNIVLPTEKSSQLATQILGPSWEKHISGKTVQSSEPVASTNKYVAGLPGGLLAKALGLGGGSYTLDAACASSLYAIKLAADELLNHRVDAVLTGGISRPDCLYTQMGFAQLHALSTTGKCSPFDEKGDGLVVGEGCGIFVLKRLEDAIRDKDHIYGNIVGTGLSNDIGGNLLSPDSEGQLQALNTAYAQAGWKPSDVDLIECHATGTPLGDAKEFESLSTLWQQEQWQKNQCIIGSVKSNVGHLLTGAGAAGLAKILLSFKHKTLPPTANFSQPKESLDFDNSPFRVLSQQQKWERRDDDTPRRAAINAFGFGGINAHILVEEWQPQSEVIVSSPPPKPTNSAIAVVGVDAHFGPWNSLKRFQSRVLGGENNIKTELAQWAIDRDEQSHCHGYFINDLQIPFGRYRIPPKELQEMLPQQSLMLQVATTAVEMASLQQLGNAGVFMGIALDLNTTNFHFRWQALKKAQKWAQQMGYTDEWIREIASSANEPLSANRTMGALGGIVASRIARELNVANSSFTISSEETSGLSALEVAIRSLQNKDLDTAIVGAVDFAGDIRAVLASQQNSAKHIAFSQQGVHSTVGEGAGAVVLKRLDDALSDNNKIHAIVRGIGSATTTSIQSGTSKEAYQLAILRAYEEAQISPQNVEYIETHGSGDIVEDAIEIETLGKLFEGSFIGSVKTDIGHTGAASGIASFIKAVLCLREQITPALRDIKELRKELTQDNTLIFPQHSQYWLHDRSKGPRLAGVSGMSTDGNALHVVLEESPQQVSSTYPIEICDEKLFCIEANTPQQLQDQLKELDNLIVSDHCFASCAKKWQHKRNKDAKLALTIIAKEKQELRNKISQASQVITRGQGVDKQQIYYQQNPIKGDLAFVFPGSGNHYSGAGRKISTTWPHILRAQDLESKYLRSQFLPEIFWNSQQVPQNNHQALIFGQVTMGILASDLLRSFGLQPQAVIGYSLGESIGLFSLRAWKNRDKMLQRINDSTLFTSDLAGSCEAVKKAWGTNEDIDWVVGIVNCSHSKVKEILKKYTRAYLFIVNTHEECVIGGDRNQVAQAVSELKGNFFPLSGITTVHCEVVEPVAQAYKDLHVFSITEPSNVRFYSAAWGEKYTLESDKTAQSILTQATNGFDFPKVVENAYNDGARIFIEAGPGNSCTRMIHNILNDKPHIALSACFSRDDEVNTVLTLLAKLITHRVPVDLDHLYDYDIPQSNSKRSLTIKVGKSKWGRVTAPIKTKKIDDTTQKTTKSVSSPPAPISISTERKTTYNQDISLGDSKIKTPTPQIQQQELPIITDVLEQSFINEQQHMKAHEAYLRLSQNMLSDIAQMISLQMQTAQSGNTQLAADYVQTTTTVKTEVDKVVVEKECLFPREVCMEFAIGSITAMFGEQFAEVDSYPTRVRLPAAPLMLVDRITHLEGEPCSMKSGRVVTEHDIQSEAWYLDNNRIPVCIAVESGQADLLLSGYLGVDFKTKGLAVYRLLDAEVTFHRHLPGPGETIKYDIEVLEFFRQGNTYLFRFQFESTVNGERLLTMRKGCAGFFTEEALNSGRGIVHTKLDLRQQPGKQPADWRDLVPMKIETYNEAQVECLRRGDLAGCFGEHFSNLNLQKPPYLPSGKMQLVDRVVHLDPQGGRFGLGVIKSEADIYPDDWFLTCHFIDDQVMPGTLMYECSLYTLRIFLWRMGWIAEHEQLVYEPIPGVSSQLKCRGQVIASTKKAAYEVVIKERGYNPHPYVIADALLFADDKPIVKISNMSLQLSGLKRNNIEKLWSTPQQKQVLYDYDKIYAFSNGLPSEAFGEPYRIFDHDRVIARLPRPPYQFLDRIVDVSGAPWKMKAGGAATAEYDVPGDEWYFTSNGQQGMPFAILLEIALQPCGWLAAYVGSALTSDTDLSFRNLGGEGTQFCEVLPDKTLTTVVKMTSVSRSGGMIIQHYSLDVDCEGQKVYKGKTYFGFFSKKALADQVGIQEAQWHVPQAPKNKSPYPQQSHFPTTQMKMVDDIEILLPRGGKHELGFIQGTKKVDPKEWFFDAHFFQDPVCPGSLGLESFLQILKVFAEQRWELEANDIFETIALNEKHQWIYRGQIIPSDDLVTVQATITAIDDDNKLLKADGYLSVDGRMIYEMKDFSLKVKKNLS
ncbi:beta-ketoacyl synthase N-terminal-like domain-containing protein [Candidatus Uabimicrobium sp. HlEnr_7]|uniref:beta-ketoacyl synthase N-terminal-like domain-containing protein n=1 Tax=Candidatus Uabimicrobium helgolandensis TaxID=3095367 RepID=UPI0035577CB2